MIRLVRRVASLPAGTETDMFSAAEEAALVLDGTAEAVEAAAHRAIGYGSMKKDELARLAAERGLDVSPRAKMQELIEALEQSDGA